MSKVPLYLFSDADLSWESEEKKAVAGSRVWDVAWVGKDEQQLLKLQGLLEMKDMHRPRVLR